MGRCYPMDSDNSAVHITRKEQTMRTIDADALIESIKRQCNFCRLTADDELIQQFIDVLEKGFIEEVDNAPTIEPIEWIPCSERLPEKYGEYLITATYIDKPYVTTDEYFSYGWDDWEEVTAWAERPKPWKRKNDE